MFWIEAGFYLTLATLSALVSHRYGRHPIRYVGLVLIAVSLLSTAALALKAELDLRLLLEIGLQAVIAVTAMAIVFEHRNVRACQYVLLFAALDVAFCGSLCLVGSTQQPFRMIYSYGSNAAFAAMCICVAVPGIRDAVAAWIVAIGDRRNMDSAFPADDWLLSRLDNE